MRLRHGSPYWLSRPDARGVPAYPRHRGELHVDIAIVGGGFTGCATAYALARAGLKIAVLEGARVGRGSAAASTALLMQEPDRYLHELAGRYGAATARRVWRLSREAVRDLVRTLGPMDCGLEQVPSLHLSRSAAGARDLRRDHRARQRGRLGGRLLDAAALRRRTGIDGTAAILTAGDAVVNPFLATHALARAATGRGAQFFERSEVLRVAPRPGGMVVETERGLVRCRRAILATGFATPWFKPLQARFTMSTTYVVATHPLPKAVRAAMGDVPLMFWDAERPYHYFRWTEDGRILFGGEDRPVPRTAAARRAALVAGAEALHATLRSLYPDAGALPLAHAWEGIFASTPDGLPYIGEHPDYPGHLFALGYGGNGMTFGFLAARLLLRCCLDRSRPDAALFGFDRGKA